VALGTRSRVHGSNDWIGACSSLQIGAKTRSAHFRKESPTPTRHGEIRQTLAGISGSRSVRDRSFFLEPLRLRRGGAHPVREKELIEIDATHPVLEIERNGELTTSGKKGPSEGGGPQVKDKMFRCQQWSNQS